jgi:hypothetical protein
MARESVPHDAMQGNWAGFPIEGHKGSPARLGQTIVEQQFQLGLTYDAVGERQTGGRFERELGPRDVAATSIEARQNQKLSVIHPLGHQLHNLGGEAVEASRLAGSTLRCVNSVAGTQSGTIHESIPYHNAIASPFGGPQEVIDLGQRLLRPFSRQPAERTRLWAR